MITERGCMSALLHVMIYLCFLVVIDFSSLGNFYKKWEHYFLSFLMTLTEFVLPRQKGLGGTQQTTVVPFTVLWSMLATKNESMVAWGYMGEIA